jgi:transposase-like protein
MHLSVRLPKVLPDQIQPPQRCPLKQGTQKCKGRHFKLHQVVCRKPLRDTKYTEVIAHRYRCLKCRGSFRVYPQGVSNDHLSQRLQALSVLLYILGLSYQGVADLLESLEHPIAKGTAYNNVQAAGQRVQHLRKAREKELAGKVKVLGTDLTHVKCQGKETLVAVATAVLTGEPLAFEILEAETAFRIEPWLKDLAHVLGAEILVTDDADGLKTVADHLGLKHQICRAHVNRNVHDLIGALGTKALEHPSPVPWELPGMTVDQFLDDLDTVEWIIKSMPANGQAQLQALAARYQGAPPPSIGKKATMWYRMRLLTLDWSENWARLALYQSWRGAKNEKLDGTNNASEQVIGQCVKERYRSMRTYKRKESIVNVSGLVGWVRANGPDFDMAELMQG